MQVLLCKVGSQTKKGHYDGSYTSKILLGGSFQEQDMRWAGFLTHMVGQGAYRVLVGRPEEKRPLGKPRRRWEEEH
jgi:hypothetical protein